MLYILTDVIRLVFLPLSPLSELSITDYVVNCHGAPLRCRGCLDIKDDNPYSTLLCQTRFPPEALWEWFACSACRIQLYMPESIVMRNLHAQTRWVTCPFCMPIILHWWEGNLARLFTACSVLCAPFCSVDSILACILMWLTLILFLICNAWHNNRIHFRQLSSALHYHQRLRTRIVFFFILIKCDIPVFGISSTDH